jgi:hypothetical protein
MEGTYILTWSLNYDVSLVIYTFTKVSFTRDGRKSDVEESTLDSANTKLNVFGREAHHTYYKHNTTIPVKVYCG